jgi:hypothetical protein
MPSTLISEKPVELGKLIALAYLVVVLSAFAWAKEFLLPLILAMLIGFLLAPLYLAWNRPPRALGTRGKMKQNDRTGGTSKTGWATRWQRLRRPAGSPQNPGSRPRRIYQAH